MCLLSSILFPHSFFVKVALCVEYCVLKVLDVDSLSSKPGFPFLMAPTKL